MSTFMDDFVDRAEQRHAASVVAGNHDELCEWSRSQMLCHCHKRKREAEGFTKPPTLWISYPTCSHCMEEVGHDGDSFVCARCHVSWRNASEDEPGWFHDEYGDICPAGAERVS